MTIQMDTAMNKVQLMSGDIHTGHMTSSCMTSAQVTKIFTSINIHKIEIEPWRGVIVFVWSRRIELCAI